MAKFRVLLDTPSGYHIRRMAEEVLECSQEDPNVDGFVFNGFVIRLFGKATVDSLCEDYERQRARS